MTKNLHKYVGAFAIVDAPTIAYQEVIGYSCANGHKVHEQAKECQECGQAVIAIKHEFKRKATLDDLFYQDDQDEVDEFFDSSDFSDVSILLEREPRLLLIGNKQFLGIEDKSYLVETVTCLTNDLNQFPKDNTGNVVEFTQYDVATAINYFNELYKESLDYLSTKAKVTVTFGYLEWWT